MLLNKLLSNLDVRVEYFTLCMLSEGWRMHLPEPSEVMLHFVLRGQGVICGPHGDAHVGPCWLAVVPRGSQHGLGSGGKTQNELQISAPCKGDAVPRLVAGLPVSPEEADFLVACGTIHVSYGESLGLFDYLREVLIADLSDSPEVLTAFQSILAEQSHAGPGSDAMTAALMFQCLVHFLRRLCSDRDSPLPWLAALEDPGLARAIDRILEDPGADHTVESLAAAAAMSRSSFAEHFAEAFRRTPMSLVHHARMQRATHLLREGKLSIDEVASRVGFSSRSHFSHSFKTHTGLTPAAYRAAD